MDKQIYQNILKIRYYEKNSSIEPTFGKKAITLIRETNNILIRDLEKTLNEVSISLLVELAEEAEKYTETNDIAQNLIKIYFTFDNPKNSFLIRAYLVKSLLESRLHDAKAEAAIEILKKAIISIMKALEIITKPENKSRYSYLAFNASQIAYKIIRNYLKGNYAKNFIEVLEKISSFLEEQDDYDFNWRLIFLTKLVQCYIDAEKKPEAGKALDKIADIIKKKGESSFQEELFRLRVHYARDNQGALGNLKKEADALGESKGLKYVFFVQTMKSGAINDNQIEKETQTFINSLYPDFNKSMGDSNIKIDQWRADLLAELGCVLFKKNQISN